MLTFQSLNDEIHNYEFLQKIYRLIKMIYFYLVLRELEDKKEQIFRTIETSQENESDEDAGVLKTNTKTMTFYHCLFGGYGPTGPMAGVGHVGAAFIRRRSPIIPALPRSFPLGSQGVQATIFKKTLFVCSPGAAVENAQFFRFVILNGKKKS